MLGQDHGPERREVFEAWGNEQGGRSGERGGEARADSPRLHGGPSEKSWPTFVVDLSTWGPSSLLTSEVYGLAAIRAIV